MLYTIERVKEEIAGMLDKKITGLVSDFDVTADLSYPPSPMMGDISFKTFRLVYTLQFGSCAQYQNLSTEDILQSLAEALSSYDFIDRIDNGLEAKSGYFNIFLRKEKLINAVMSEILDLEDSYGKSEIGQHKRVMVEFSSPNTNKPLHLGHLRNISLGDAMCRILKFSGYEVIAATLLNDRGVHIAKAMLAYQKWGAEKEPDKKSDHFVGDFYVLFERQYQQHPELLDEARLMLREWEAGKPEVVALWQKIVSWAEEGFQETYRKLGVRFDHTYYESKIYTEGRELVLDALKKGFVSTGPDGEVVARLEQYGLPDKVLLRSDGTSLYITQDIYLAKLKFDEYHLDFSIYCIGSEQELQMRILFQILDMMGVVSKEKLYHLSYGMVFLPEGKMKSREGKVVDADDLVTELEQLARTEIIARIPHGEVLSDAEQQHRANTIALAALKYYLLFPAEKSPLTFDPQQSLSFTGSTGPYILYTIARMKSILRKAESAEPWDMPVGADGLLDFSLENVEEEEYAVVMQCAKFPEAVAAAAQHYDPSLIAKHLLELAQRVNTFYHSHSVLDASEGIRDFRLSLMRAAIIVLSNGMRLLGSEILEEM